MFLSLDLSRKWRRKLRKGFKRDRERHFNFNIWLFFQFLKGVRVAEEKIIPELMNWEHKVRVYMPFEVKRGDGHTYMVRRCQASPEFVWYGVGNVMNARVF